MFTIVRSQLAHVRGRGRSALYLLGNGPFAFFVGGPTGSGESDAVFAPLPPGRFRLECPRHLFRSGELGWGQLGLSEGAGSRGGWREY